MKRLMGYLKRFKLYVILAPFLKLIETIIELLNPILVAKIVDVGIKQGSISYITKLGVGIVVLNIVCFCISIAGQKCASKTSAGVSRVMREDLFSKITSLSHSELDKFGTASLINRLTNDITQIENAVSVFLKLILRAPLLLIGAFVLSFVINKKVSLIFLVLIVLVSIILVIYTLKTSPYFVKIRNKLDNVSRVTRENLSGTRVIRAFNQQEREINRFNAVSDDHMKTCIRVSQMSALLDPIVFLIVDIVTVAILYFGGVQVNIGGMTQGDIIALIDYVSIITISLLILSSVIMLFVRTVASLHRLDEVMNTEPKIKNLPNSKAYKNSNYDALMEFKSVCFNYDLNSDKLSFIKDLSFSIYPHQTIGIIGGTGSGKTTIANLMMRFYDVTSGEILYKGKNLKDYTIEALRNEISIVQQRSTLFAGSLRENMQIRKANATDEEIIQALKISQAWPFVSEWANKLDYQIMRDGKNVSGGQMQRLTIARALIGNPEMLILDDSSSALDFLTDSNLRRELKKLDSTLVIISQRATTIKSADLIIVLDNGDVVGMGKHHYLMKNCDIYREIYESQSK